MAKNTSKAPAAAKAKPKTTTAKAKKAATPQPVYDYGASVISTDLKYDFNSKFKNTKINGMFSVEVRVYCGRKKMHEVSNQYSNVTLNYAIKDTFKKKIENNVTFHKGHKYYATFKVYEMKPIKRAKYVKTDTYIDSHRRKYLLQERINIFL